MSAHVFQDRRPSSNMDPYHVTDSIVRTCCLKGDARRLSRVYEPADAERVRALLAKMNAAQQTVAPNAASNGTIKTEN